MNGFSERAPAEYHAVPEREACQDQLGVLGIAIHAETSVMDDADELYDALTGDQCAITTIRVLRA